MTDDNNGDFNDRMTLWCWPVASIGLYSIGPRIGSVVEIVKALVPC